MAQAVSFVQLDFCRQLYVNFQANEDCNSEEDFGFSNSYKYLFEPVSTTFL